MLPKVSRDDAVNGNETSTGVSGTNNKVVRILSATTSSVPDNYYGGSNGGRGIGVVIGPKGMRRPISTKSAHLTPIPLEAGFLAPQPPPVVPYSPTHQRRPYLPYSASSPTLNRARQNQNFQSAQKYNGANYNKWKGDASNRARAHSHRSTSKTWSARGGPAADSSNGKSMPYLVPKTAKGRVPSSSSTKPTTATVSSVSADHPQSNSNEEKISTKMGELQTSSGGMHLVGGMIMMGKPGGGGSAVVNGGPVSSSLTKDRVQVVRTKEEREKNPDCIRLDKRGVRTFPDIGGGESTTLKLLSLQHNLITRLENVPLLSQLVVLDLYDNRVERICGLQGLPSLRVLLLGKNRIKRIEGLDSLKRLEILDLHGNQLRYVDNLGALSSLRVLNLAGNLLRNIRNLGPYGLSSLVELNLKRNRIKNLDGLQKAPHLKKLLLANNDLQLVSSLAPLRKLNYLSELVIDPNPLLGAVGAEYQNQILTLFPNLVSLDRNAVTEGMKQEARLWHRKKMEEEERRKMEEEKMRQEMAQSVGPPGSREQVIFQARRRWESLRNFVKSSNGNNNGTSQEVAAAAALGKKGMKSMKKVVTVATEVKAKTKAEFYYPPATLDLEEFPNGLETLDQMESILSCSSPVKLHSRERNNGKENGKLLDGNGGQETSQDAPLPKSNLTRAPVEPEELRGKSEVTVKGSEAEVQVQPVQVELTPSSISEGETPVVIEASGVADEKEESLSVLLDNQLPESRCASGGCSARSGSAKVAVVRPLIHRSSTVVEISSPENEVACALLSTSFKDSVLEQAAVFVEEDVVETGTRPAVENTDGRTEIDVPQVEENADSNVHSRDHIVVPPESSLEIEEQCQLSSKGPPAPVTVAQQDESTRVKAKLLKHLRSISLDSCPHPFLRPGGQKPGDGSSINSASPMVPSDDDDNDGEEDDDNDNEVQDYDIDDDDAHSIATSTCTTVTSGSTPRRSNSVVATTNRLLKNGMLRKQNFPRTRSQRIKMRDRAAKLFGSTSDLSPRSASGTSTSKRVSSGTGTRGCDSNPVSCGRPNIYGRVLRRCDSAASLTTSGMGSSASTATSTGVATNNGKPNGSQVGGTDAIGEHQGPSPFRKQGMDFLVEVEGKMLNVFGQGGLRHALTAFASNVTCHVITAKFHYISYDSIIPFFGKLRQVYPSMEHFHFRANNICTLAQLDALSDLQGLTSLFIAKEGNPIVTHEAWVHYASYRLSHWGLQVINGKEISSEYRGGASPAAQAKAFESLGFLALSCLPQTALTPLAKRLHMLHCFCCCSPSTSSDESNRRLANHNQHRLLQSPPQPTTITDHSSSNSFCTAWDDDPVLLDVIGKEALVYCPPILPPELTENPDNSDVIKSSATYPFPTTTPSRPPPLSPSSFEKRKAETLGNLVNSGVEIVEKVDMLEKTWPTLMTEVIQEMLMDFRFMDSYMKKELKKCQDITLINQQQHQQQYNNHNHAHGKKIRH